jgi:hypothetical protein
MRQRTRRHVVQRWMQRKPIPGSQFIPARRYGRGGRLFAMEIGSWEGFRFITSSLSDAPQPPVPPAA